MSAIVDSSYSANLSIDQCPHTFPSPVSGTCTHKSQSQHYNYISYHSSLPKVLSMKHSPFSICIFFLYVSLLNKGPFRNITGGWIQNLGTPYNFFLNLLYVFYSLIWAILEGFLMIIIWRNLDTPLGRLAKFVPPPDEWQNLGTPQKPLTPSNIFWTIPKMTFLYQIPWWQVYNWSPLLQYTVRTANWLLSTLSQGSTLSFLSSS